jgi:hypothetical protein
MKVSKYRNKKVSFQGEEFDSKREMQRYLVLKDAESKGIIQNLQKQVNFELIPKIEEEVVIHLKRKDKVQRKIIQLPIIYRADFVYEKDGVMVVEDVKASANMRSLDRVFLLKEKLFRWKYGFSIKRVYKPNDVI